MDSALEVLNAFANKDGKGCFVINVTPPFVKHLNSKIKNRFFIFSKALCNDCLHGECAMPGMCVSVTF